MFIELHAKCRQCTIQDCRERMQGDMPLVPGSGLYWRSVLCSKRVECSRQEECRE